MEVKRGDIIGEIIRVSSDSKGNENFYKLVEGKVKSITFNSKGKRIKADHFYTLDGEEVEFNTNWLLKAPRLVLTHEPFVLTDELRDRVNGWIKFKNEGELKQ